MKTNIFAYLQKPTTKTIQKLLEKHTFVSHTKHTQQKINRSTSFVIDIMYYVNFRI